MAKQHKAGGAPLTPSEQARPARDNTGNEASSDELRRWLEDTAPLVARLFCPDGR